MVFLCLNNLLITQKRNESNSFLIQERTRDFLLGKEVLYQLSHCRIYYVISVTTKIIIYNPL